MPERCQRCGRPVEIVKLMYGSIWGHVDDRRQFCRCPSCGTLNDPDFRDPRCDYCAARIDGQDAPVSDAGTMEP